MNELLKLCAELLFALWEALQTLLPILIFFLFFQFIYLRLPRETITRAFKGLLLSLFGLALFLFGVSYGFLPAGRQMGIALGSLSYNAAIIPIGFLLGFVATLAEPAVRVLSYEVDRVSSGSIREKIVLYTLAAGVAIAVSLGMARIIYGIPIHFIIVPGYLFILIATRYSSSKFVAIAFDSGGVVTGPMITTFILAITIGVAEVMKGRDPVIDGFGLIALVAMVPILVVLVLGLFFERNDQ